MSEMVFRDKRIIDMRGKKIGRLTVIDIVEDSDRRIKWICKCECGNFSFPTGDALRRKAILSCGCLRKEKVLKALTKHGETLNGKISIEYYTWLAMRDRCNNANNQVFKYYGGRGITVCERWNDFENFLNDLGRRPSDDYSIDRINNNGNYEPENVRWATKNQQTENKRSPSEELKRYYNKK